MKIPKKIRAKPHPLAVVARNARLAEQLRQLCRTDLPAWAIEAVAVVLRTNVDFVRRIPANRLPYVRVGKRNLYLPEDVITYIKARRDEAANMDLSGQRSLIDSLADSVRKRSPKRRTQ